MYKKYSLLSHRPDWRHKAAISGKATLEDCKDPLIKRYLQAKASNFTVDTELAAVVTMPIEDRGIIEALYLGGATIATIAKYTMTASSTVQLVLDLFFDVKDIRDSPVLRTQMAHRELNRSVKSYKKFAVKNGWKKFLQQFFSREEVQEQDPPTIPKAQQDLLMEIANKIPELSVFETGTVESKELQHWSKILLELSREMRVHDWEVEKEKELDIHRIMEMLRSNDRIATERANFEYLQKGMQEVEDESETKGKGKTSPEES